MSVFGDYARYYDVLYQDKDYTGEVAFVLERLGDAGCIPNTLLDLGCGTGRHALEMAKRSICVTGVDMSDTMLAMGQKMLCGLDISARISLTRGDARTVRLEQHFDAVTSLFHVMSYQTTEKDALAVLCTTRKHLNEGGYFFFDFWHGPGVLTDPPAERYKVLENEYTYLTRHAHPLLRVNDNIVEVHYDMTLTERNTQTQIQMKEMHAMRYWFMPELRYLATQAGFTVKSQGAWMKRTEATQADWNGWMLLQRTSAK